VGSGPPGLGIFDWGDIPGGAADRAVFVALVGFAPRTPKCLITCSISSPLSSISSSPGTSNSFA
jgi:hypothetical protein